VNTNIQKSCMPIHFSGPRLLRTIEESQLSRAPASDLDDRTSYPPHRITSAD